MRIGDKVRMLHDNIEGVVIKVVDDHQVMIEDTMGFDFPVLIRDLIVVNPIEDKYFDKSENEDTKPSAPVVHKTVIEKGIYFAVVSESKNYGLYLINNTGQTNFVSCYAKTKDKYQLLDAKVIDSKSKYRANFIPLSTLESWERLYFIIHTCVSSEDEPIILKTSVKLNVSKVIQSSEDIPFVEAKGYLRQLDGANDLKQVQKTVVAKNLDKGSLQNKLNEGVSISEAKKLSRPKNEIDLHTEKLGIDENLSNAEILIAQVKVFEDSIEAGIANSMKEIVFVHGLGNGVLRKEIHKRIKNYPEVKFFEDAQKSRFGYGATKIVFS